MGDRLQVFGVDASHNSAQMVEFHPVRDWANDQLVSNSMGSEEPTIDTAAESHLPVTLAVFGSEPAPALPTRGAMPASGLSAFFVNLRPKALLGRTPFGLFKIAGGFHSRVMHGAKAMYSGWLLAIGSTACLASKLAPRKWVSMTLPTTVMHAAKAFCAGNLFASIGSTLSVHYPQIVTHSAQEV